MDYLRKSASSSQKLYNVYPNPAKDFFNIELIRDLHKVERLNMGFLYDNIGILRAQFSIKNKSSQINVSHLVKGLYLLKIEIDGMTETHSIIIQ